jgi:hypothetical protein
MNARHVVLACLAGLAAGPVVAAGLPDPTRPPALVEAGTTAAVPPPSGLQSIIRRQGAKPAAVINGSYVELGGYVGEARLERVGEDSVDLRSTAGRETLQLTPGIGKQPVANGKDTAKRSRNEKRRTMEDAKP